MMMDPLLPILLVLIPASVLGRPDHDPWTPDSAPEISENGFRYNPEPASEQGLYLALIKKTDTAYDTYLTEYYPKKESKAQLHRLDQNTWVDDGHSKKQFNPDEKVKLTIVAHGRRKVNKKFQNNQNQYGVEFSISKKSPQELASVVHSFVQQNKIIPDKRMRFITCNAGSQAASNYMTDFILKINELGTTIREVVAYRTYVETPGVFEVITSAINTHVEEVLYYFESKGIPMRHVREQLLKSGILRVESSRESKNKMRMLFILDDKNKVHRYNLVKPDNNNNQETERTLNLESGKENFKKNLNRQLRRFCPSGRRGRRSPSICSLKENTVEEDYVIKENTLTIEEGHVKVEVVNRYNPEETHIVSYPLEESFYMKQVKENARQTTSLVKAGGTHVLEHINSALAKYGILAGFIGAGKFFAQNDTIRGAVTLTQSLHGLGELTNLNQQLSRISQNAFQKGLEKAASEMGMEETLSKVTTSVERFGESAAGRVLKNVPLVGLAFQGWFIAEDVRAVQHTNRSDPNQNKYFGLEVTNLVLDVTTTALMIGEIGLAVAFPPAAAALQCVIIGLTIVRMSISDFYCDVVSELDKLPQGAGDFDKMVAVIIGLEEGAVDFITGGLRREIEELDKEAKQNQELLHNLSKPESYYKITADVGNVSTLDLMGGMLSQYGGFVTVQLLNNGSVSIQIGGVDDGKGGVRTIQKLFYDPSIQNIVLGVGESSEFLYTQKAAHLFWVIPVRYTKVISAEIKLHSSAFGTYYGNDKDNTFIGMQNPGKRPDVEFVIRNYHYTIYGHGGDDTFILGPQTSVLSGGEGKDFYVFPTSGTHAEIDNFSMDMLEDHMLIKAPFSNIDCNRNHADLLLIYGSKRYRITIKDWFAHGNVDHYQHMTFQSSDGVTFRIVDKGLIDRRFHAMCVPETLDKTKSPSKVPPIILDGEFKSVIKVIGSNFSDTIVGNEHDNVLNGGYGEDMLEGGAGADTYVILQGQGCDRINNYAKDEKVDKIIFQVPFSRIQADLQGEDLIVVDEQDVMSTRVQLTNWTVSRYYQHVAFISSDHVIFHISNNESEITMTALMVDLSSEVHGSTVNLSDPNQHELYVITVFDSAHDDDVTGNGLGNFLSCSGGRDHLQGEGGSDKYVIKSGCKRAYISNFAEDHVSDILFFEQPFQKLRVVYQWPHVILKVDDSETEVHLLNWLKGPEFQHMVLQTIDGVISMLPSNFSEPEVITPFEIDLSQESCIDHKKTFDLSKDPFGNVERFKAKSSNCSYSVIGNSKDNYIDPGIGNGMKYQYLTGGNGSDTYVFGHGYGYGNEIDNEAADMKTDRLFLDVLYKDIVVFLEQPHVALSSRSRDDSVHVRLLRYLKGPEHQHLLIKSSDGFFFQVNPLSYPYKSVFYIDASLSTKSCNISCAEGEEFLNASQIYGATKFSNYITGSMSSSVIKGGNNHDYLQGNEGNEKIEGGAGDDVIIGNSGDDSLFGGEGDDDINAGAGNDLIYGGRGADKVDGGPGFDTVFFSGDVRTSTGVSVDLNSGKGQWADAEGDTYTGVEAVSGTNFNDLIIGDDEDNDLKGKFGNDTLVAGHGADSLSGGPGSDLYILDECSGLKRINNFASDEAQDYILIRDFNYTDACFFLLEGNLVISFSYHDPLLSLIQQNDLTVLLEHWNNSDSFYQHVDFVFANDTLVKGSFFNSATEISPTLSELNSTSPTLNVRTATETAVEIEVERLDKTEYGGDSDVRLKYHLKVSDDLLFSDSLDWENQTSIRYSGLLSGVFYTFQFYVSMCEFPLLELAKTTQRTKPNPPTSINLSHITHSSAFIEWAAPSPDSDPNHSQYTYAVNVVSHADSTVIQTEANITNVEITGLKPGTTYQLSLSSVIEGVKSQEVTVHMKTSNLCPTYTAPMGTRVVDEKMTRYGPVVVIECEEGFQQTSGPEILCLEQSSSSPCVPQTCTHEFNVIPHGSVVENDCFTYEIQSVCQFGHFHPPIQLCCPKPSTPVRLEPLYYSQHNMRLNAHCPHGYRLSGPSDLTCNVETGQWSDPLLPSCSPIPCPDPPDDPHGTFRSLTGQSGSFTEGDPLDDPHGMLWSLTEQSGSFTEGDPLDDPHGMLWSLTEQSGSFTEGDPPDDPHGMLWSLTEQSGSFTEGDPLDDPHGMLWSLTEQSGSFTEGDPLDDPHGMLWSLTEQSGSFTEGDPLDDPHGMLWSLTEQSGSFTEGDPPDDPHGMLWSLTEQSGSFTEGDPLDDPHDTFRSLTGQSDSFTEGDYLTLECDAEYHSSAEGITCRNGEWENAYCEPNARLINTYRQNYKLYGQLEQWTFNQWTGLVASGNAENLARICCENRGLVFVRIRMYGHVQVECSMVKLDPSGREYVGKAEVNQGDGWEKICIDGISAAESFCGMVFQDHKWTVSLPRTVPFHTVHTYQCNYGHCSLEMKRQTCNTQIQCRAMCDRFLIPNGNTCDSAVEGDTCYVSCNRLYNLQGSSVIRCTDNGWSHQPYCTESGECGYENERGPHSVGCLIKLWTEVGCSVNAKMSPTKGDFRGWFYDYMTVAEMRQEMSEYPRDGVITYNPNCQVDEVEEECFPGESTVLTSDWNQKTMSELRVGEKVLALDAHGELAFSEVILWLDRRPAATERYVLLTTEGCSDPLSLSEDHVTFIATSNGTVTSVATMIPVFAKDLQPGHLIHRYDPATGVLVARRVTDVRESVDLGAYAPMTVEGNLIVDGHLVSCYALQCRQYLAHLPFAPYRLLHTLRSHVPLFKDLFPVKREQEDEGMHWYANAWHKVGQWFDYPFGKTCYPRELRLYHYP